jgi:DNA-directed RNA polymerase subunit RPC12/RpoP
MAEYQCTICSYRFVGEKVPMRCPYCAAKSAVTEVKDAQNLLDDSNNVEENLRNLRRSREE